MFCMFSSWPSPLFLATLFATASCSCPLALTAEEVVSAAGSGNDDVLKSKMQAIIDDFVAQAREVLGKDSVALPKPKLSIEANPAIISIMLPAGQNPVNKVIVAPASEHASVAYLADITSTTSQDMFASYFGFFFGAHEMGHWLEYFAQDGKFLVSPMSSRYDKEQFANMGAYAYWNSKPACTSDLTHALEIATNYTTNYQDPSGSTDKKEWTDTHYRAMVENGPGPATPNIKDYGWLQSDMMILAKNGYGGGSFKEWLLRELQTTPTASSARFRSCAHGVLMALWCCAFFSKA